MKTGITLSAFVLLTLILLSCDRITKEKMKLISIDMPKTKVEEIIGKNEKGQYDDGQSTWILSYSKSSILISITRIFNNKEKTDSTVSIGYLGGWTFEAADREGNANVRGFGIGHYGLRAGENVSYVYPIMNLNDIVSHGLKEHIFRITGPVNTEDNSQYQIANKVEDITCTTKENHF
jgi:hypothetical protein